MLDELNLAGHPLTRVCEAIAGHPLSRLNRHFPIAPLFEPICGPDSPIGRTTTAINTTVDRLLAPLHQARAAVERQTAPLAAAHRERLDVPASRSRFTFTPADLHF